MKEDATIKNGQTWSDDVSYIVSVRSTDESFHHLSFVCDVSVVLFTYIGVFVFEL